jgi:hypothetical protein
MLSVTYAECHIKVLCAKCRYAECHYAECRGAAHTLGMNERTSEVLSSARACAIKLFTAAFGSVW